MNPSDMPNAHLSNSIQFCLRKLRELEDYDSYEFYYDRLVAVVEEMAKRELSPSPIPNLWVVIRYTPDEYENLIGEDFRIFTEERLAFSLARQLEAKASQEEFGVDKYQLVDGEYLLAGIYKTNGDMVRELNPPVCNPHLIL